MNFGENVRRVLVLKEKGWSQSKLSRVADMDATHLSKVLNGLVAPTAETIAKIANALGVSPAALFIDETTAQVGNMILNIPQDVVDWILSEEGKEWVLYAKYLASKYTSDVYKSIGI